MPTDISIKIIYFFDTQGNRLTGIVLCGLVYVFINFLSEYEVDKKLVDIINFNIENEDKLLTEEEFRKIGLHIESEFEVSTNFIIN